VKKRSLKEQFGTGFGDWYPADDECDGGYGYGGGDRQRFRDGRCIERGIGDDECGYGGGDRQRSRGERCIERERGRGMTDYNNYTKTDLEDVINDIMNFYVSIGRQPADWVVDEDIWERAKEIADESNPDNYWAFVTYMYKKLGGRIG
jgi:hypothetical protein